jgi:hypothetical protein
LANTIPAFVAVIYKKSANDLLIFLSVYVINLNKNYGYSNLSYLFPGNRSGDGSWPLPM